MSKLYIYLTGARPGYSYSNTYNRMKEDREFILEITNASDVSRLFNDKKYRNYCDRMFLIDNLGYYDVTNDNLDDFIKEKIEQSSEGEYVEAKEYLNYIEEISSNDFKEIYMRVPLIVAKEILDLNPELKESNIYLSELYNGDDFERISSLIEMFNGITDKIYIDLKGNAEYISLDKAKMTIDKIHGIANEIKSLDLSPFEQIMYAYDIAKNRIYNKENVGEKKNKSRDLTEVLFGDNIVCAGFVAYFNAILQDLGFNPEYINLSDTTGNNVGHRRTAIYIKDPKYGIDGFYYFDPTFDSRKIKDSDEEAINRYKCFALTKCQMDIIDNGELSEDAIPFYSTSFLFNFEKACSSNDAEFYNKYALSAKTILRYTNNDKNKPQTGGLNFDLLVDSVDKMNRPLTPLVLAEALKTVREKQNMINPKLYPKCDEVNKSMKLFRRSYTGNFQHDLLLTLFEAKDVYKEEYNARKRIRDKFEEQRRK